MYKIVDRFKNNDDNSVEIGAIPGFFVFGPL
jgi:hypothetical protein